MKTSLSLILVFVFISNISAQVVGLTINGRNQRFQNGSKKIVLKALQNDVIFGFKVHNKPNIKYKYRLEGYDNYWITSNYPQARYTNLKGNDYTLQLQIIDNNKQIEQHNYAVIVERSLTEESWFLPSIISYVILILGAGLYFLSLYNFRQKHKVQQIRNRIAADLHDEIGATLSSIAISANLVQRKMGDKEPQLLNTLERIKNDSKNTVTTIRDTVWALNADNDNSENLFEKMRSFAYQILTAQGINFHFNNKIESAKLIKINMDQRRNLYLIFKEAINNAAKYSKATEITVHLKKVKMGIEITIDDNGIGFDHKQNQDGNGLKNFKSRAKQSFITFKLQSEVGKGTHIYMMVPEL